jgi:hypothetical protein
MGEPEMRIEFEVISVPGGWSIVSLGDDGTKRVYRTRDGASSEVMKTMTSYVVNSFVTSVKDDDLSAESKDILRAGLKAVHHGKVYGKVWRVRPKVRRIRSDELDILGIELPGDDETE